MGKRLDQERQQELEPKRIETAKLAIQNLGYEIIFETDTEIRFMYKNGLIRFYPYSGWHSGTTIKDGRGLAELLNQIKH